MTKSKRPEPIASTIPVRAIGIVRTVAVHEDDDVGVLSRLRARLAGAPIAPADGDDFRARPTRHFRCAVGAGAVDHNDTVDYVARQRRNDCGDRFGFKECRNDHSNPLLPCSRWSGAGVGRVGCVIVAQYESTPILGSSTRMLVQMSARPPGYRLQRRPQLAHAVGGFSDKSALRKSR